MINAPQLTSVHWDYAENDGCITHHNRTNEKTGRPASRGRGSSNRGAGASAQRLRIETFGAPGGHVERIRRLFGQQVELGG